MGQSSKLASTLLSFKTRELKCVPNMPKILTALVPDYVKHLEKKFSISAKQLGNISQVCTANRNQCPDPYLHSN